MDQPHAERVGGGGDFGETTLTKPLIGFAGMTHLGLNSAVASAERGFDIVCFDQDVRRIDELNDGRLPVVEPELPAMFARRRAQLTFTADASDLKACDVIYVAPDVPTDDKGVSDLGPIRALIRIVDAAMAPAAVLVVLSQVPPGFTRSLSRPLETRYYQVETLIFGRAIERALHPERFIVGCADPAVPLPAALATYLAAFECPVLPMRYESAELCKISINMVLVAQVSCANTIAELCEKIGADYDEIVPALRLDRRIGAYAYISPGMGISGGNLERDLATFNSFGDALGTSTGVVRAWQHNSGYRRNWALRTVHATVLRPGSRPAHRGAGPRLQGEHRFRQKFPGGRADRGLAAIPGAGVRSRGGPSPGLASDTHGRRRRDGGLCRRRCGADHDAVARISQHRRRPAREGSGRECGHRSLWHARSPCRDRCRT